MRIAVMSDFHLGAKAGTSREQDSFDQAEEAIRKALSAGADIIIILGDIFDRSRPSLDCWAAASRIFTLPKLAQPSGVRLVETLDKPGDSICPIALQGVPVVAIFGNHERRPRGEKNPVEALEAGGEVIMLNANSVTFEKNGERIAVHGLSYVPERDLRDTLRVWNPKPVPNSFNILLLHQSIGNFTFSSEERPSLQLSDLPPGFDLYLDGHVHYKAEATVHGKPLLLPGSTERTQLSEIEAESTKGFYLLDMGREGTEWRFIELESPRDFFYERLTFTEASAEQIYRACREKVKELLQRGRRNAAKEPIIKLKLEGTLANGVTKVDFDPSLLTEEFRGKVLLEISHEGLVTKGLSERIAEFRKMREEGATIEERGLMLLLEYAKEIPGARMLDIRRFFELFAERGREEAKMAEARKMITDLIEAMVGGGG